jgi:hypothetical protein
MTPQHHRGCNLVSLRGILLITLLWRVAAQAGIITALAAVRVDYYQHQQLYLQVRLTQLPLVQAARE